MKQPAKIKVLIVDDSAFMRKIIGDILSADPAIEVVGRARNGKEAVTQFEQLVPDVVTLDMEMPGMNGIEVLREMMKHRPTAVVMVSSLTKEGANVTMQALDAGALDFVTKPLGTISLDMEKVGDELRQKVIAASRASVKNASMLPGGGRQFASSHSTVVAPPPKREFSKRLEMVVIAASTGGPMALQEVLPALPASFPLPILVVQHMPPGFTSSFAARLNEKSALTVMEAVDGMAIKKGRVLIAPGGYHLAVEKKLGEYSCQLLETPPVRSVRPAADVLFTSVAEVVDGTVIAVVLTGMGKDGLDGTTKLRSKGAYVIAESKETCVIYGMPGAIVDARLADEVLPLYQVASALERIAKKTILV